MNPSEPTQNRTLKGGHKAQVGQILRAEYSNGEVGWEAATLAPPELLKTVHEATYVTCLLST